MNAHIESVHEGKKPRSSDATFSENDYLNRHIEAVHDESKPFKSNSCGASFTRNTFEPPCWFSSCRKDPKVSVQGVKTPK